MRLERCWYCSSTVYPGHGSQFVRNDSKVFNFCRSKCFKHFKRKHHPTQSKWTKAYRRARGKEMLVDSTFDFETKRNRPIRYDRDLMVKTVQAMKKVSEIREQRKLRFFKLRMEKARRELHVSKENTIKKHIHIMKDIKSDLLSRLREEDEAEKTLKFPVSEPVDDVLAEDREADVEMERMKKVKKDVKKRKVKRKALPVGGAKVQDEDDQMV